MKKPIKVSDPSQKWKIGLFIVALGLAIYFGWLLLSKLDVIITILNGQLCAL